MLAELVGYLWGVKPSLHLPFISRMDMQESILEHPFFAQQEVSEETNEVDRGVINAFMDVVIVGTNQGIAEIPRMFGKYLIVDLVPQRA